MSCVIEQLAIAYGYSWAEPASTVFELIIGNYYPLQTITVTNYCVRKLTITPLPLEWWDIPYDEAIYAMSGNWNCKDAL